MEPPLAPSASSRPTSARGVPLTLAERVALYCHQSTAANNAAVLRSLAKPTADEIAEFLQQSSAEGNVVYEDPALVRLLLTDSDYDAVCRETLRLEDAIAWHARHGSHRKQASTSSLHLLLLSAHVFTDEELRAACDLAASQGMDEVLRLFPVSDSDKTANRTASTAPRFEGITLQHPTEPSARANAVEENLAATDLMPRCLEVPLDASNSPKTDLVQLDGSHYSDAAEDIKGRVSQNDLITQDSSNNSITPESIELSRCLSAIASQCVSAAEIYREESSQVKPEQYFAKAIEKPAHRLCKDEASIREGEDREGEERSSSLVDSSVECCRVKVTRECAECTVEATISTVVDQSVQQHLSTQHVNMQLDQLEKAAALNSEDVLRDQAVSTIAVESVNVFPETILQPRQTASLESASHIESIVRSLDADLLDDGSADQEDFAFGEDAMLLGELPATEPETHPDVVLVPNDPVEAAVEPNDDAKIVPALDNLVQTKSFKVGDVIDARYKGTVHFFPGTIVAVHAGEGTFDVSYNDGDAETQVPGDLIRYPAAGSSRSLLARPATSVNSSSGRIPRTPSEPVLRVGDAVEARYRGLDQHFPGEIAVVLGGGRYEVRYADGEYEGEVRAEFIRPLTAMQRSQDRFESAVTVGKATLPDTDVCVSAVGIEQSVVDQTATIESASPPCVSPEKTTKPQTSSLHVVTSTNPESRGITDSIDLQHNEGEHRKRIQATPLISEINEPGPYAVKTAENHESKERPHPAQQVQKSESTRDSGNHPPRVNRSLTDETMSIRPASTVELPVVEAPDGDSIARVTRNPVLRSSSNRDDTDIVEQPVLRRPLSRSNSKTKSRGCMTPRNSVPDNAERPMEDGNKPVTVEPFRQRSNRTIQERQATDATENSPTIDSARALLSDAAKSDEDIGLPVNVPIDLSDEDDDDPRTVDQMLHATERISRSTPRVEPVGTARALFDIPRQCAETKPKVSTKKKKKPAHQDQMTTVPVLSPSTLRYFSPQPRSTPVTTRTQRPKTNTQQATTPRAATASQRERVASGRDEKETTCVSWKELEEWKNVDAILNRKRRVVHNGQVEGSDVPWGEEFAAIQSLKRFSMQYPDVLRDHIESQLAEVVNSNSVGAAASRPMTTKATSAARDALYLVKDLAFLLRHRLAPFFVFHSQKRYLCDTAYDVLEALVTHCSSRKLVVALLKQALRFPRDDLRLVNLTCLYVEKCLATLSVAAVEDLVARCAGAVLDAVAELLTCKSAACQSALQKSLLVLQDAVGEDAMENVLADHLVGNALALVRRHVALAETAARGPNKSPSASPKKLSQQHAQHGATPAKQAAALAAAANGNGGVSILQRMLAQRQNRVVPAPE